MKFDPKNHLKWIEPQLNENFEVDFQIFNQCVLIASNQFQKITGFTVFDPRDLNKIFFRRLTDRQKKPANGQVQYKLYVPAFLKQRLQLMVAEHSELNLNLSYTSFIHLKKVNGQILLRDKLRVICVDDSPVVLKFLVHHLTEFGFVDIVSQISNSAKAVEVIEAFQPDLLTMDMQMPQKNGVQVIKELFLKKHYPVILISSLGLEDGSLVMEALNAGAFDYIQKPKLDDVNSFKEDLRNKILAAVEGQSAYLQNILSAKIQNRAPQNSLSTYDKNLIWCLGASTGGTVALTRIFTSLPAQIPPTFVVQHIPPLFSKAFAESLDKLCPFTVKEATHGELALPNHVYIAPGGLQMGIENKLGQLSIQLFDSEPVNRFKPSVDFLFLQVAELKNIQVTAALLTGMGKDGALGLLALKNQGAYTLAQDLKSSAVFGMPRHAIEMNAVHEIVSLDEIARCFLENKVKVLKKVS